MNSEQDAIAAATKSLVTSLNIMCVKLQNWQTETITTKINVTQRLHHPFQIYFVQKQHKTYCIQSHKKKRKVFTVNDTIRLALHFCTTCFMFDILSVSLFTDTTLAVVINFARLTKIVFWLELCECWRRRVRFSKTQIKLKNYEPTNHSSERKVIFGMVMIMIIIIRW